MATSNVSQLDASDEETDMSEKVATSVNLTSPVSSSTMKTNEFSVRHLLGGTSTDDVTATRSTTDVLTETSAPSHKAMPDEPVNTRVKV